jgi:hypothetical protein
VTLTRRQLVIGSSAVAALAAAFLAGRYSAQKPEERTEVRTEQRAEAVVLYAAHAQGQVTDRGTERVRTVVIEKRTPVGEVTTTTTTDTLRAADLTLHFSTDWTGTESRRESASAAATTVRRSTSADWRLGLSALWSVDAPGPKPDAYALELDRRIVGPFSLGLRGQLVPDDPSRSVAGVAISVTW